MWRRREEPQITSLRYCQTAHELPLVELYGSGRITIAVAQTTRSVFSDRQEQLLATGVLHTDGGYPGIQPLLPSEIEFFDATHSLGEVREFGDARPYLYEDREYPHFRLGIVVRVDGPALFSKVEAALLHARSCDRQFVHLSFIKQQDTAHRELPSLRGEKLGQLARRIHEHDEAVPAVSLTALTFEDRAMTAAPAWATSWSAAESLRPKLFHDRRVATNRLWRKLPPPRATQE